MTDSYKPTSSKTEYAKTTLKDESGKVISTKTSNDIPRYEPGVANSKTEFAKSGAHESTFKSGTPGVPTSSGTSFPKKG